MNVVQSLLVCVLLLWCQTKLKATQVKRDGDPPVLTSIEALKKTGYGHSYPRHGLKLLFFIIYRTQIRADRITPIFNPQRHDYGFHNFNNHGNLLPYLGYRGSGRSYYIVGNINYRRGSYYDASATQLDPAITMDFYSSGGPSNPDANIDRVIIDVTDSTQIINRIFITQHNPRNHLQSNDFDPAHTYEIHRDLVNEINNIRQIGIEATSAMSWFLWQVGHEQHPPYTRQCVIRQQHSPVAEMKRSVEKPEANCLNIMLQVRTSDSGSAIIKWDRLPPTLLFKGVSVTLTNGDGKKLTSKIIPENRRYGTWETNIYIDGHLSAKLVTADGKTIMQTPPLDDAFWKLPKTKDDVSIQLYAANYYAGARVFIRKNTRNKFDYSWVGFYESPRMGNGQYVKWGYLMSDFTKEWSNHFYDVFTYVSGAAIKPGVQVRFFKTKKYDDLVRSDFWEA